MALDLGSDAANRWAWSELVHCNPCRCVVSYVAINYVFQPCLLLTSPAGAFIGVNAAFISILTEWLSDLRRGYCSEGWWSNQQFCCWEIEEVDACAAWTPWSPFTLGNWVIYVLLAVASILANSALRALIPHTRAYSPGFVHILCITMPDMLLGQGSLRSNASWLAL